MRTEKSTAYFFVFMGLFEKYGTNRESVTLQAAASTAVSVLRCTACRTTKMLRDRMSCTTSLGGNDMLPIAQTCLVSAASAASKGRCMWGGCVTSRRCSKSSDASIHSLVASSHSACLAREASPSSHTHTGQMQNLPTKVGFSFVFPPVLPTKVGFSFVSFLIVHSCIFSDALRFIDFMLVSATMDQPLGTSSCINVRWAQDDPNPSAKRRKANSTVCQCSHPPAIPSEDRYIILSVFAYGEVINTYLCSRPRESRARLTWSC
eukprot:SAG31_NODE_5126_length_2725_cov_1.748286_2_plen_263_part_00